MSAKILPKVSPKHINSNTTFNFSRQYKQIAHFTSWMMRFYQFKRGKARRAHKIALAVKNRQYSFKSLQKLENDLKIENMLSFQ